ncbi:hypothetical protein BSKO_07751 [Bryopsis sp. KO-2023]|nr:hypothetical protein BSKO_07751 [Bryopsis sp. KO-2023]
MTRFVGEALGVRSGRQRATYSNAELRKNMELFLKTGVHPDVEKAREARRQPVVATLPETNVTRPNVFLDVAIGGKSAGRLVVELFDDLVPLGVAELQARCSEASRNTLKKSKAHKLLPQFGIFLGRCIRTNPRVEKHAMVLNLERGAVAVSRTGDEVVISLGPAVALDATHQVVGKVTLGTEVLDQVDELVVGPGDVPLDSIAVTRCGATNRDGTHDSIDDTPKTVEEMGSKAKEESNTARENVRDAVEEGLLTKRKVPDGNQEETSNRSKRGRTNILDSWLDVVDSDSSDDDGD